mmetsp:Transcript_30411/g.49765  ORF Transcript_30411/g.49765 Transcript_30411/m.49765 type:complete len:116 (+) Transcript_30411:57-404(+)
MNLDLVTAAIDVSERRRTRKVDHVKKQKEEEQSAYAVLQQIRGYWRGSFLARAQSEPPATTADDDDQKQQQQQKQNTTPQQQAETFSYYDIANEWMFVDNDIRLGYSQHRHHHHQ